MSSFRILGGKNLKGEINPQGAKNETLQIICAVLLTEEKVKIENIPNINDVNLLIDLIKGVGVNVNKINKNSYSFEAKNIDVSFTKTKEFFEKSSKIRGSIMMMGPMLSRFGSAYMIKPGGDKIGRRRIDTHLIGMEELGAKFTIENNNTVFKIHAKRLSGTNILLDEASVTGTANIIMAAVLAKGKTTIYNAACEPYIQQLCKMLNSMGAIIKGIGSNYLKISGVDKLKGTNHKILPDMIEIGSFIGMAAMTQSDILIKNVKTENINGYELNLDSDIVFQTDEDFGIHHQFYKTNNNSYFFIEGEIQYHPCPDECEPEYPDIIPWQGDKFIEIDESGNVLWEWSTFDYLTLNEYNPYWVERYMVQWDFGGNPEFDWTHANSVYFLSLIHI